MADSLIALRTKYPQLGTNIDTMATLATQKQIHQLTTAVLEFLETSIPLVSPADIVDFYNGFVGKIASKMNPTQIVRIIGKCVSDATIPVSVCVDLLEQQSSSISKSKDAVILSKILRAEQFLSKQKDIASVWS